MPLTVRKFNAQVKDPTSGDMIPAGLLSSDSLEAIEAAETAAVAAVGAKQAVSEAAIELKGATTLASIPADYTTLDNEVDDLNTQINDIQDIYTEDSPEEITEYSTGYGYIYNGKVAATSTTQWVQRLYSVNANEPLTITATLTQQQANAVAISFSADWVSGTSAETLQMSVSGDVSISYTPNIDGVIAILDSVNSQSRATNVHVSKLVPEYIDFQEEINELKVGKPKTITIKTDGSGDFQNFRAATEYIKNNPYAYGYIIEVYPGIYDVLADYTSEEINAASYSADESGFCGITISNGVYVKGVGPRDSIIIKGYLGLNDYTSTVRSQISTLHFSGNSGIENVTVTSENIRYTIHDDFSANVDATHIIKNCVLNNIASTNGISRSDAYGLGTKSGETIIIEDCILTPNLGYHNNVGFTKPDSVRLINTRVTDIIGLNDTDSDVTGTLELFNSQCGAITHNILSTEPHIKIVGVGESYTPIDSSYAYETGDVIIRACNAYTEVGKAMKRVSGYELSQVQNTSSKNGFIGICIKKDNNMAWVQTHGYISSALLGTTDTSAWQIGDYLGIGSGGYLAVTSNATDAVAVVEFSYNSNYFIRLIA